MTLQRLLALWRQWMDDKDDQNPLHSTEHGVENLNAAVDEACIRGKLARATYTQALVATQQQYAMPAGWYHITSADHVSADVRIASVVVADRHAPNWRTETGTAPRLIVPDVAEGYFSVSPIPSESGSLTLHGYRTPVGDERFTVSSLTREPAFVPPHKHAYLVHWACHMAYLTRDSDAGDIQRAEYHAAQFELHFGQPFTAAQLRVRQQVRGQSVKGHFF